MHKRNWQHYNKSLIERGSLSFLIDPKILKISKIKGKFGRPQEFSDQLIIMLMMVKIHYRLTYRTLQGFIKSFLRFAKIKSLIPSYSLICKRAGSLKTPLPKLSSRRPMIVILDSSGAKICGEGEWKVKIHGKSKRRKWMKLHIAIDAKTQEIVAEVTTQSSIKDGKMTDALLRQVNGSLQGVLADGAYDDKNSRKEIKKRGARAFIPPPRNGRLNGDQDRDEALRVIRGLGGGKEAKSLWGKLTGYSRRALVETAFSRIKGLFGERLFSKTFERQSLENRLRCQILNKMRRLQQHQHPSQ